MRASETYQCVYCSVLGLHVLSPQYCSACNSAIASPVFPDNPERKMDCTPLERIGCGLALSYCQWHLQSHPWTVDCLPIQSDQPHETLQVTYSSMWVREEGLGPQSSSGSLGGGIPIAVLVTRLTGDRLLRMTQLSGYSRVPPIASQGRSHS